MAPPLVSARAKIRWAHDQFKALDQEMSAFIKSDDRPYRLAIQRDPKSGHDLILLKIVKETPIEWAVRVGEITHDLRSALDHIMHEFAGANGKVPPGTEFPIFIDEDRYRSTKRGGGLYKIRGCAPEVQAAIEDMQPFKRQQGPTTHRLWILQQFSNFDKHRLLHLAGVVAGVSNLTIKATGGLRTEILYVRPDGEIEDGAELVRYRVSGPPGAKGAVQMKGDISYNIAFNRAGPGAGAPVYELLNMLGQTAQMVLDQLAKIP